MSVHTFSVVEYYSEHEKHRCGYCKSIDTNYSHGMWAHNLTVQDYQDLIDRGWRRSGQYCYKPTMNVTCCPMYTIKCSALEFKVSKSQKKVLKRFHRYVIHGSTKTTEDSVSGGESSTTSGTTDTCEIIDSPNHYEKFLKAEKRAVDVEVTCVDPALVERKVDAVIEESQATTVPAEEHAGNSEKQVQEEEEMPLPPCRKKAKVMRLERKKEKLTKQGYSLQEVEELLLGSKNSAPQGKSLEDFVREPVIGTPVHKFEIRLVRSSPPCREFEKTAHEAHKLYVKYQTAVHGDPREKCTYHQFTRFLVSSPLQFSRPIDGPSQGYGSFHMQYWLDGKLIAVGVVDILPLCLSSVYFFYDPDLSHLSLGTYASLQELILVRSLHNRVPDLQYYYMGFYIHSCPKMRYKANYSPSFLLCPETYTWHPVEKCMPKLDISKYCRFQEDLTVQDENGTVILNEVLVLWKHKAMPYYIYQANNGVPGDEEETELYAKLVGMACARRMLLAKN